MSCERVRGEIVEITLEGGTIPGDGLPSQHLRACLACRSFLARVVEVDAALRVLPMETTPVWVRRRVLERIALLERPRERFLPWTLWLPAVSLVAGLFWAYLALLWSSRLDLAGSLDPVVSGWLVQVEEWFAANQVTLSTVTLSVTLGLLFTAVAIGLGLYVGRSGQAISH
jgi:hypothetical protein